ncbi:NAD-dependent epimerase/dehydratase family protein [Kluyvera intermedia]|uniref:NAD-dependent epimerase/dehydratase family protein n=1 Tax=Kluyvera intermedia TaxID=61648 RepID=UPI000789A476|nr:NAD-dependent epimerase/dehydratase family protein [Kluyvera intermedia]WQD31282.1 NAD-dependent epimerase/dehydratase family protein [Kluyvera intermedia]VDZ82575.1 dTDP-glucose 4,6-dehydratase [Kluyvera intermedia]
MMNRKKIVVVSGASGFIGKHMLEALQLSGIFVIAITRNVLRNDDSNLSDVKWCDWEKVESLLAEYLIDSTFIAVIHLATEYGRNLSSLVEVEDSNVVKPLKLLDLAVKYKANAFINTDSFFSKKEFSYRYMQPYIITKKHFAAIGQYYSELHDISFVNMRLEHVYGPGDGEGKFIPYILSQLIDGQLDIKCTSGMQVRDFVYVDDVVAAYLTVLEKINDIPSYVEYQVGTGYGVSLQDFLIHLQHLVPGSRGTFDFGALPQRENEIMYSTANNNDLVKLGWKPKFDFKLGIRKLLENTQLK